MLRQILTCILATALMLAAACDKDESPVEPENGGPYRNFALGFTDFPHARTEEAYLAAWSVIENDADMVVLHFDDGVPWPEALEEIRYDQDYENELNAKESLTPTGHIVYAAVTPIAFTRDSLAAYRGATPNQPLFPPWDTLSFDDDDVITAFSNHCIRMIEILTPDFFAYAIEANMLITLAPDKWSEFIVLAEAVYTTVKASYPNLPVFITLHTEFFHAYPVAQKTGIAEVLPYTDLIALSTYGYALYPDPEHMPIDHFSALHDLAPGKGFAIAETAWPAEDVTAPYPVFIPATDTTQLAYIDRLLYDADSLDASFVSYFFSRDFDEFWEAELQYDPMAELIRFWRDTGLYDGVGNPRPALDSWRAYLEIPRK